MANPDKYQGLSTLRARILKRVGFVNQDASNQHSLIDEFLQSSQQELYIEYNDMLLQDVFLQDIFQVGESLYDIVDDCDPEQVGQVVYRNGDRQRWKVLKRGIPLAGRDDDEGDPRFYEIRFGTSNTAQIEFYPTPNQQRQFGYEYKRTLKRFTQANDLTTIDSELVFLTALSKVQAHYGDTESSLATAASASQRLYQLRARSNQGIQVTRGARGSRPEFDNSMHVTIVNNA